MMRHAASQHLYSYWNQLRRDRPAPERSEIDPAEIRSILAYTFILEMDAQAAFPFRLSGARINALFDRELKGRSFIGLWRDKEAASMATLLPRIVDHACPIVARINAAPQGYAESAFELLLLPLWHEDMTRSRILGCLAGFDHPAWLGLLPVERLVLRGLRQVQEKTAQNQEIESQHEAEQARAKPLQKASVFSLGGHLVRQYGHLRVYPGGRQDALA
ncbi:PAS domain-containing protein [Beijerinckia indica]|nr:PAS domain-containing protein [Beijerinckia indica]